MNNENVISHAKQFRDRQKQDWFTQASWWPQGLFAYFFFVPSLSWPHPRQHFLRWSHRFQTSQAPSIIKFIKHYPKPAKEIRDPQIFIMEGNLFQKPWKVSPYILLVRNWLDAYYKSITGKRQWDYHKWLYNWFIPRSIPVLNFPENTIIMSWSKLTFSYQRWKGKKGCC